MTNRHAIVAVLLLQWSTKTLRGCKKKYHIVPQNLAPPKYRLLLDLKWSKVTFSLAKHTFCYSEVTRVTINLSIEDILQSLCHETVRK